MSPKLHSLPSVLLVCYFKNKKALKCTIQGLFGGGDEGSWTPVRKIFILGIYERSGLTVFPTFSLRPRSLNVGNLLNFSLSVIGMQAA